TAAIDLAEIHSSGLQKLLEHPTVMAMLAGRDSDRRHRLSDGGVAENIIGTRRLLDPNGIESGKFSHRFNRLIYVPNLICIHHQRSIRSDLFANKGRTPDVIIEIAPDLHLELSPTVGDCLPQQ